MALTLTRRQLTNDLTEVGGTGPKSYLLKSFFTTSSLTFMKQVNIFISKTIYTIKYLTI